MELTEQELMILRKMIKAYVESGANDPPAPPSTLNPTGCPIVEKTVRAKL